MGAWAAPGTAACTACTYSITRAATSAAGCLACGASLFSSLGVSVCWPFGRLGHAIYHPVQPVPLGGYSSTVGADSFAACTPARPPRQEKEMLRGVFE